MMTIGALERRLRAEAPREWHFVRSRALRLLRHFVSRYGAAHTDVSLSFIPGRIEVLGKHTDYAGGHTLVCAVDRGFLMIAGANRTRFMRMSEDRSEFPALEFLLSTDIAPPSGSWGNYPMTVSRRLAINFGACSGGLKGVDVAFSSDLPVGSGMSGSSALMMMSFLAIAKANNLAASAIFRRNVSNGIDLAMYLACCENGQTFRGLIGGKGVGTFGGSEDHTAILLGKAGRLSLYRYAPTVFKADLAWPDTHALAVCFSGVQAEKTGAALDRYNLASRRAREAVTVCNRAWRKRYGTLREVVDHAIRRSPESPVREMKSALRGGPRELGLAGRAVQFYLEDRLLLPEAVRALAWGDIDRFGDLIDRSHEASRQYLRNIAPQVDWLHRSAARLHATGSCGFGAGFGGSILAVVPAESSGRFLESWKARYRGRYPREAEAAQFFLAAPADGIRIWDGEYSGRWVDQLFGIR